VIHQGGALLLDIQLYQLAPDQAAGATRQETRQTAHETEGSEQETKSSEAEYRACRLCTSIFKKWLVYAD
jgi:hypothetical protein